MKVNSEKNRSLIKQFPFIDNILKTEMVPLGTNIRLQKESTSVDNLTIRVQKADGDLLFRQAQNSGLGDHSFIITTEESRKSQVMRVGEYLFAIDDHNTIINRLEWLFNENQSGKRYPVYAKNVLWATKNADASSLSDPIWDNVAYLVWATVSTWHTDTGVNNEPESRFGECLERNIEITIYGKPDCGFRKLDEKSSIWSNLRFNSRVMMRAVMDKDTDLLQMLGCQWELCKFFQEEVWDKGMKQAYDQFKTRGASGQFGSTNVLVADMCGYHRVMFQNNTCWISFQLRPGGTDMYVLGQDGTLPQLRQLVRSMVLMWIQSPECRENFKADEKVTVM
ncbi:MAG: hypothetical protein V4697_01785 [Patescibacteria group bacterium]